MKLTIIATAVLLGAFIAPVAAFAETKVIDGCEMTLIDGSNAYTKVNPTCNADTTSADDSRVSGGNKGGPSNPKS